MADESVAFDAKELWLKQPTEEMTVSPREIERRAQKAALKVRRGKWIFAAAACAHTLCHFLRSGQQEFLGWIGAIEFISLGIVVLYWPYQYANRAKWPLSVVPRAGSTPSLDHYRTQLELRRNFVVHRDGIVPLVVIAALFLLHAIRYPLIVVPIALPFVVLGVYSYGRWKQELPEIQRELEDLKTFKDASL